MDVISVFSRGGHNFDRLPRGEGQNMKKNKIWKAQKIIIFKIMGQIPHP